MVRDILQEKLYQMELKNPSENQHLQSFFRELNDKFYFLYRAVFQKVEKVYHLRDIISPERLELTTRWAKILQDLPPPSPLGNVSEKAIAWGNYFKRQLEESLTD